MNPNFKLRFDQMKESNPAENSDEKETGVTFNEYALARPLNLCLVWPDGKRFFLNYSYLVAGELNLDGEKNVIILYFSSHVIKLLGYGLEALFGELMDHLPRIIFSIDERYATENDIKSKEMTVIEISIQKAEN